MRSILKARPRRRPGSIRLGKIIYDLAVGGGFEVVGPPTIGQVPKWDGTDWVPGDDLTATPGMSVQSDWTATDPTGAAFILNKPTLFSGDYGDLANQPTIPAAQVQTDWAATSGLGQILNQPDIDDVLTGTPTFTGNTLSFSHLDGGTVGVALPNLNDFLAGQPTISGQVLTFPQHDGGSASVTLPTGGMVRRHAGKRRLGRHERPCGNSEPPGPERCAVRHFRLPRQHAHLR